MKLIYILAAILAVSVAETDDLKYDDLVAMESMELKKVSSDIFPAASEYYQVPQHQTKQQWGPHVPTWAPSNIEQAHPVHISIGPSYAPPVTASPPGVQSDDVPQTNRRPINHWNKPQHPVTTPAPKVIKDERHFWPNGAYRYEYQLSDGTHVFEEGYYTDPKQTEESLVKKGWYSFVGTDGKTYTVNYWADYTGFHTYPAYAGSYSAKEETENKEQPDSEPPQQIYYPRHQNYNPYYPPQARK